MALNAFSRLPAKLALIPIIIATTFAGGLGIRFFQQRPAVSSETTRRVVFQGPPGTRTRINTGTLISLDGPVASVEASDLAPRAMASADFDGDGIPDIVYSLGGDSKGQIRVHRGEREMAPRTGLSAEIAPAQSVTSINVAFDPEFVVAGDFNSDGNADIALARTGAETLSVLDGDGAGHFPSSRTINLPGRISALLAGDINRLDQTSALIVGLDTARGPEVLIFESQLSAPGDQARAIRVDGRITGLATGRFTSNSFGDLIIIAGSELIVASGDGETISRQSLPFSAQSPVIGHFTSNSGNQLALMSADGGVYIVNGAKAETTTSNRTGRTRQVVGEPSLLARVDGGTDLSRTLSRAHISNGKLDDLVVASSHRSRLHIVTTTGSAEVSTTDLDSGNPVVAVMQWRGEKRDSLLLLRTGQISPSLLTPEAAMTFTVNSTGDGGDVTPGDGICNSASSGPPVCTLRAAIQEANANAGADTIVFNIGAGAQTIGAVDAYPAITEAVTIDGTPQGGAPASQVITVDGTNADTCSPAFTLTGGNSRIRGIGIGGFNCSGSAAILIVGSGNNTIDGNTIFGNNYGIVVDDSPDNLIGGTTASSRNVIYGNRDTGLYLLDAASTGNRVQGNQIGVSPAGTTGGQTFGIYVLAASGNIIGGTTAAARNIISGNDGYGVAISAYGTFNGQTFSGAADGMVIQGNYIGLNANGVDAPGNGADGIVLVGSGGNTIGGSIAGAGNVITRNGANAQLSGNGVNIFPAILVGAELTLPPGTNNLISTNSIFSNTNRGINLGAGAVIPNDAGDGDIGPNQLQNFPVVTYAVTRPAGTTIRGTLTSTPNQTFAIELFSNTACDSSGYGEGLTFLGRTTAATDANGSATFAFSTATVVPAGQVITATATDANSNTSEFSLCFAVRNASADLLVTGTATPQPVNVGSNLTYNLTVTNIGPDDATGITLNDTISVANGQYSLVSATTTAPTGSCSGTGPINCNLGNLATGASTTVVIVIAPTINQIEPANLTVTATNTATVAALEADPVPANNTALTAAIVGATTDLAVSQTVSPPAPLSGSTVTYSVTIANNGPSVAGLISLSVSLPPSLFNVQCTAPAGWSCSGSGNSWNVSSVASSVPPVANRFPVFLFQGTLTCLAANTLITSTANVLTPANDPNPANNTSVFSVTAIGGTAAGTVTYDAGGTAVSVGPVVVGAGVPASGTFTLRSTGCLPMNISSIQLLRLDATTNLTAKDDTRYFSLRRINADGSETALNPSGADRDISRPIPYTATMFPGESVRFRVVFNPPLPFFAGVFARSDLGLNANQVLPDQLTSQVVFNFVAGSPPNIPSLTEATGDPGTATAIVSARVSPAVQIIPREGLTTPGSYLAVLERVREDFRVKVSLYDANKNVTRITYQFYDTFNQTAGSPIVVDLTDILRQSALLPGQCYTLQQDFLGAGGRPDVTKVRVTVTDADGTTVSASSSAIPGFPNLAETAVESPIKRARDVVELPVVQFERDRGNTVRTGDNIRRGR